MAAVAFLAPRQFALAADNSLPNTPQNRGQLSAADYKFAGEAARGGMMEVQAGELARTHGFDQAVKDFGERMVTDHTKIDDSLKALAVRKGAILPMSLDRKGKHFVEHLSKLSGKDFDKAYARSMVKDHETDVKVFQKESKQADDVDVRAFATTTTGILEQHLAAAQQMEKTVQGESPVAKY
jgi:putative membrane protein